MTDPFDNRRINRAQVTERLEARIEEALPGKLLSQSNFFSILRRREQWVNTPIDESLKLAVAIDHAEPEFLSRQGITLPSSPEALHSLYPDDIPFQKASFLIAMVVDQLPFQLNRNPRDQYPIDSLLNLLRRALSGDPLNE